MRASYLERENAVLKAEVTELRYKTSVLKLLKSGFDRSGSCHFIHNCAFVYNKQLKTCI